MKAALIGAVAVLLLGCSGSSVPVAQPSVPASAAAVLLADTGPGSSQPHDSNDFTTTGDWKISWTFDCSAVTDGHDWLILAVYRWRSTHATAELFDTITPDFDPAFRIGVTMELQDDGKVTKGTFFIRVLTECKWTLRVRPA